MERALAERLRASISRGLVAHGYYIYGGDADSRCTCIDDTVSMLVCERPRISGPCGSCAGCLSYRAHHAFSVLRLVPEEEKRDISIDAVRDLHRTLPVLQSPTRIVVVVEQAALLSAQAVVAMLKMVEEPLERVVFIFGGSSMQDIPPTLASRIIRYYLPPVRKTNVSARDFFAFPFADRLRAVERVREDPVAAEAWTADLMFGADAEFIDALRANDMALVMSAAAHLASVLRAHQAVKQRTVNLRLALETLALSR